MAKAVHLDHVVTVDLPVEVREVHRAYAERHTRGDESVAFRAMVDAVDLDMPIPAAVSIADAEMSRLVVKVNDEQLAKIDEMTRRWSGDVRMDALRRLVAFMTEADNAS